MNDQTDVNDEPEDDSIRIIHEVMLKLSSEKIRAILDEALKESGDFGVYGNLEEGVEGLVRDFNVTVTVRDTVLSVDCGPRSGAGHDCQFNVERSSRRIDPDSVVFGEVCEPPPFLRDEEDEA